MKGVLASNKGYQLGLALEAFMELQGQHLHGLQAGRVGKLQVWLEERQQSLERLRQFFAAVHEAGIDDLLRRDLLGKLSRIIDLEETIQGLAAAKKEALAVKLAKLRTGKKALGGYSQKAPGAVGRVGPRFVSSKG